jgi:hypothetical protein
MLSPVAFATAFVDGGVADASADRARAFRKGPSEAGYAAASSPLAVRRRHGLEPVERGWVSLRSTHLL